MSVERLVQFETSEDGDARRIGAVLVALGYEAVRVFPDAEAALTSPEARVTRAVAQLARTHKFTTRQQEVTLLLVQGETVQEVAGALGLSRATVKWHTHNVYCATNTNTIAELTRKVFNLAMQGF